MEDIPFLLICGVFIAIGRPVCALCPENPFGAIQMCSKERIDRYSGVGLQFIANITKASEMCKSNKLTQAIDCIKKIMDDCSDNQKKIGEIKQLINIQGWKVATKYLCGNIDYFEQNKDCMRKGIADTHICAGKVVRLLQADMNMKRKKMRSEGKLNKTILLNMKCRMISKMVNCITISSMKLCPEKIMDVIKTVIYGFVPPRCDDEIPEGQKRKFSVDDVNSSGSVAHGSAAIVFLTAVSSGFLAM